MNKYLFGPHISPKKTLSSEMNKYYLTPHTSLIKQSVYYIYDTSHVLLKICSHERFSKLYVKKLEENFNRMFYKKI
jgi:hypothetical protein